MFVIALTASSAPPSTAPGWASLFGTVAAMVTAAGVVIGGIFAYFKFSKGRTFRARISLRIDPKLTEIGGSPALQVSVTVRNEGLIALLFPSDLAQRLYIGQADSAIWNRACGRQRQVRWENSSIQMRRYNLAVHEGDCLKPPTIGKAQNPPEPHNPEFSTTRGGRNPWWQRLSRGQLLQDLSGDILEPGEEWIRCTLVPVSSEGVAYLLRAEISACRHVAVRHVRSHRRHCLKNKEVGQPFVRDVILSAKGSDSNGQRPAT